MMSAVAVDLSRGVFIPEVNHTYYVTPEIQSLFKRLGKRIGEKPQKVMLKGPHGAGKTELAMQFAARNSMSMMIMDCANLKEPRDWFGYKTIEAGEVVWHESQFDKVISAGNHVILFDEINRVHPNILNTLLPLLDGRGFTYLEEKGSCIKAGPNLVMFATMNEGAAYTGTNSTDIAMRDRWSRIVEVTYLPKDKEIDILIARTGISEKAAKSLVDIANQIRKKSTGIGSQFSDGFSTRQLIACAEDFVIDGPESLTFTMTNLFSAEGGTNSERAAVLQLIQGKFGVIEAAVADKMGTAAARLKGTRGAA
jgi:cobaltochelatase CobS